MKKTTRLNAVPQGLEWLAKDMENIKVDEQKQMCLDALHVQQCSDIKSEQNAPSESLLQFQVQLEQCQTQLAQLTQNQLLQSQLLQSQLNAPSNTGTHKTENTTTMGLKADWTRSTIIIKKEHLEKLKIMSSIKGTYVKDLIDQALDRFFTNEDIKTDYVRCLGKLKEV
jgi:hypothetical protein